MSEGAGRFNIRKNVIFSIASFAINIVLVFISYKLLIVYNGMQAVGLWSTLFAWSSLIRLGDVGMANASIRFIAQRDVATDAAAIRDYVETGTISNAIMYALMTAAGYVVLSWFLPQIVAPENLLQAQTLLPKMLGIFFLTNLSGVIMGCLQGLHLAYRSAQLQIAGAVLQTALVIALVPSLGIDGLALAQVAQYAFLTVVSWMLVRSSARIPVLVPTRFSMPVFREMFGFSMKAQLANIANGFFEPLSKILVSRFAPTHVQGFYELAYKTIALPRNALAAGLMASLPMATGLMNTDIEQARSFYRRAVRNLSLAGIAVIGGAMVASPVISWLWIGHVEMTYVLFVAMIGAGFIGNMFGAPAYNLGMASGAMRNNIVTTYASLAVLGGAGTALAFAFGPAGAVAATAIALAASGLAIKVMNEALLFPRQDRQ